MKNKGTTKKSVLQQKVTSAIVVALIIVGTVSTYALARQLKTTVLSGSADAQVAEVLYPADVFDLTNWKLTLPEGNTAQKKCSDGTYPPLEILQSNLRTYSHSQYFHLSPERDGIVFTAPANGAHTCGSNYSRSELREMTNNGKDQAAWSSTTGTHSLEITQAVLKLPVAKPHVVVGQIHDSGDDVVVFRVEGPKQGAPGGIKLYVNADGEANDTILTENYQLGTPFTVGFDVQNGETKFTYNGQRVMKNGKEAVLKKEYKGAYFKAGAYIQASCSYASDGHVKENCSASIPAAEVVIFSATVCHDGICTGGSTTPPASPPDSTPTPAPTQTPTPPVGTPEPTAQPTPSATPSTPGRVTGLKITSPRDSKVFLKWNPYPGAKTYKVLMAKNKPNNTFKEEESTSKTSITLEKASCKNFYFKIVAYDSDKKKLASSDIVGILVAIGKPVHPCD